MALPEQGATWALLGKTEEREKAKPFPILAKKHNLVFNAKSGIALPSFHFSAGVFMVSVTVLCF